MNWTGAQQTYCVQQKKNCKKKPKKNHFPPKNGFLHVHFFLNLKYGNTKSFASTRRDFRMYFNISRKDIVPVRTSILRWVQVQWINSQDIAAPQSNSSCLDKTSTKIVRKKKKFKKSSGTIIIEIHCLIFYLSTFEMCQLEVPEPVIYMPCPS